MLIIRDERMKGPSIKEDIMDLRIIQTYHGTGGKEGYRFEVEKYIKETDKFVSIGTLVDFPTKERIVNLGGTDYEIFREYDCNVTPEDEEHEKMIIELRKLETPKYTKVEWKTKK